MLSCREQVLFGPEMLLLKACCAPARITFLSSIWVRAPTQVAKSFTQQTHGGSNCFRRSLKTSANVGSMRRQTAKERAAKLPKEFEQVRRWRDIVH